MMFLTTSGSPVEYVSSVTDVDDLETFQRCLWYQDVVALTIARRTVSPLYRRSNRLKVVGKDVHLRFTFTATYLYSLDLLSAVYHRGAVADHKGMWIATGKVVEGSLYLCRYVFMYVCMCVYVFVHYCM